jgi:hypothetical protein
MTINRNAGSLHKKGEEGYIFLLRKRWHLLPPFYYLTNPAQEARIKAYKEETELGRKQIKINLGKQKSVQWRKRKLVYTMKSKMKSDRKKIKIRLQYP